MLELNINGVNVIKTLNEKIIANTKFKINTCLEFACALRMVGKKEMMSNIAREMNFNTHKRDEELVEALEKGMSKYIKTEIEYFFSICSIEAILAAFVADYDNIENVNELLKLIERADETILFKYLGGIFISEQLSKFNIDWNGLKDNLDKMKCYIEECDAEESTAKERLLECFENPEETKQRLCFLFKQFYQKSYQPIEEEVLSEIRKVEDEYRITFNSSPQAFIERYFFNFFKVENGQWDYKFNIHLSLFLQVYFWNVNIHDYKEKCGWNVLGIRTNEFYFKKEAKDRVDRFLKVLSDKRRVDIIKLLSYKSYYGYEIAAKLELTPATVNYHINFLMDADIISFDREENKVYYTLNKDKFKGLLKETGQILLNE